MKNTTASIYYTKHGVSHRQPYWKKEQWFQLMQMVVTLAALSVTSIFMALNAGE